MALVFPFCISNINQLNYDIVSFIYLFLLIVLLTCINNLDYPQLLEDFQTSYPTLKFPSLPERGNFDLQEVLRSPYFFNWIFINCKSEASYWHIATFDHEVVKSFRHIVQNQAESLKDSKGGEEIPGAIGESMISKIFRRNALAL